jgi:hypothetical protein
MQVLKLQVVLNDSYISMGTLLPAPSLADSPHHGMFVHVATTSMVKLPATPVVPQAY